MTRRELEITRERTRDRWKLYGQALENRNAELAEVTRKHADRVNAAYRAWENSFNAELAIEHELKTHELACPDCDGSGWLRENGRITINCPTCEPYNLPESKGGTRQ